MDVTRCAMCSIDSELWLGSCVQNFPLSPGLSRPTARAPRVEHVHGTSGGLINHDPFVGWLMHCFKLIKAGAKPCCAHASTDQRIPDVIQVCKWACETITCPLQLQVAQYLANRKAELEAGHTVTQGRGGCTTCECAFLIQLPWSTTLLCTIRQSSQ